MPMNPAQCHQVIWTSASISAHEKDWPAISQSSPVGFSGHLRRYNIFGSHDLTTADVRPLPLVPFEHQEAGDVNARVGAGDNTHQECESEVIDFPAAENIKRHRCQEHGSRGNDRAAQGLI